MSRQPQYRIMALVLSGLFVGAPLLATGTASAEQLDAAPQPTPTVTHRPGPRTAEPAPAPPHSTAIADVGEPVHSTPKNPAKNHKTKIKPFSGTAGSLLGLPPSYGAISGDLGAAVSSSPAGASAAGSRTLPAPTRVSATVAPQGVVAGGGLPRADSQPVDSRDHASGSAGRIAAASSTADHLDKAAQAPSQDHVPAGPSGLFRSPPAAGGGSHVPAGGGGDLRNSWRQSGSDLPGSGRLDGTGRLDGLGLDGTGRPVDDSAVALRPLRTGARVGLLGVVAVVCAIGVLAAAIRSIAAQRANRPKTA